MRFKDTDVTNLEHRILGGGNQGMEYSADVLNVTSGYHRWDIANSEKMRLIENGNLGIGTTSPDYLLHLEKSGTIMAQLKATDSNQAYMKFVNSTTGDGAFTDGLLFGLDTDESAVLWNYEATALRFATSGTERMRISSAGNVGINETNPAVPLHISRDSASGENIALLLDNNDTTAGNEIGILVRTMVGSANTDFEIFGNLAEYTHIRL